MVSLPILTLTKSSRKKEANWVEKVADSDMTRVNPGWDISKSDHLLEMTISFSLSFFLSLFLFPSILSVLPISFSLFSLFSFFLLSFSLSYLSIYLSIYPRIPPLAVRIATSIILHVIYLIHLKKLTMSDFHIYDCPNCISWNCSCGKQILSPFYLKGERK